MKLIPSFHHQTAGFTMLELMVVVAVSGAILMIAIPNFIIMIERNKISSHIADFVSAMHYARSQAMTRGTYVTLCRASSDTAISPGCSGGAVAGRSGADWGAGYIVFVDDDDSGSMGQRTVSGSNTELLLRRVPQQGDSFTMFRAGPPGQYITFNPLGQLAGNRNNGMQFALSGGNPSHGTDRTICIARGGRIRTVPDTGTNACQI